MWLFLSELLVRLECVNSALTQYAGSKDHIKVQGEILEGLVARIVSQESSKHMEKVLKESPPPPTEGGMSFYFFCYWLP